MIFYFSGITIDTYLDTASELENLKGFKPFENIAPKKLEKGEKIVVQHLWTLLPWWAKLRCQLGW